MKFCKGKIKDINKKLVAGTLAFALAATFSGCAKDFNYSRDLKNGKYSVVVTGDIDWNTACDLKLLELKILDENVLFLARCYEKPTNIDGNEKTIYEYYDVFEDFKITELIQENKELVAYSKYGDDVQFVKEQSLEEYLTKDEYKQKKYSVAELKVVYERIKQNYEFENNKTLTKGK